MKNKKLLALLLVLCLMICLLPAAALADGEDGKEEDELPAVAEAESEEESAEAPEAEEAAEEEAEEEADAPLVVAAEETAYPLEGETVYNNGGTVYNNGALVYNNGGVVYNNGGTVYNNGGVVFANGGTVYNNGGTVYRNDAKVYAFEDDGVVENHIYGYCAVTTAEDYSALVSFEGLTEDGLLPAGGELVLRPLEGLEILSAETDAGVLTENEDGSWTLSQLDADATLTITVRTLAPAFDLDAGTYAEEQQLTITGPDGAEIYYTLDGSDPDEDSLLYETPIQLAEGCTVEPVESKEGEEPAEPVAFTVENPGSTEAVITSVTLSGKNAEFFVLSTEEGGSVKAGKTDDATWTIQAVEGLTKGSYKATVTFTLDSGATLEFEIRYKVK